MAEDAKALYCELEVHPHWERHDRVKRAILETIEKWYQDNPRQTSHVAQRWVEYVRKNLKRIWFLRVGYNEKESLLSITAIGHDRGMITVLAERN